jgi:hypothetical protein
VFLFPHILMPHALSVGVVLVVIGLGGGFGPI